VRRFRTIDDLDVRGRRVLVRADLNVPMKAGIVTDATRITRLVPTMKDLLQRGAKVIVLSHFGRPKAGPEPALSLRSLVEALRRALGGVPVRFAEDCIGPTAAAAVGRLGDNEVLLLENLRFHDGEEANAADFAAALAALGEAYVNDAFSAAHRAHASVEALARLLPAAAGRAMQAELDALEAALAAPQRPLLAIVGGAKVSTKLAILENLVKRVDALAIVGGMANTFLFARGVRVGRSLCEAERAEEARRIEAAARLAGCTVILPTDAAVATELRSGLAAQVSAIEAVPDDAMILDIGPRTVAALAARLGLCATVVWNGPLGAFETPPFDAGTTAVARAIADLTRAGRLLSVAGGGDTLAALEAAGAGDGFSYLSTAGGAFLEWLEGRELPGVAALAARS